MYPVLVTLLAVIPAAEPFDKEQVRKVLSLPKVESRAFIRFSSFGRMILPDSDAFLGDDCAAAERALQANASDPNLYRLLSDLYGRRNETGKAEAARVQAAKLFQIASKQLPSDGLTLARYADCMDFPDRADEAEAALRRAVALSPREWECWTIRARLILAQNQMALGGRHGDMVDALVAIEQGVRQGKITEDAVRRAKERYDEMFRCFDQAAKLAPGQREVWFARCGSRTARLPIDFAFCCLHGTEFDSQKFYEGTFKEYAQDLRRAVAAMPDDFRVLGSFAVVESGLAHKSLQAMPLDSITSLSDDSRVQIRRATAQLRKAAAGENLKDATDAAELLGLICSRVAEPVDAEELLDRLLERRPSLDGAWDIRFTLASCQSAVNADRLLAACRKRLQYNDSSRNRWKLAMVYDAAHMPDEAVHVLEQGLQKEPNDYLSNVFLAVILMKRNGPYEQVKVRQAIDRALKEVQKKVPPDPDTVLECFVLEVAHFALSAQYESLYMWLDLAERKGWNDERILKLRKIVGPPILLPPPGIGAPPAKIGPQ